MKANEPFGVPDGSNFMYISILFFDAFGFCQILCHNTKSHIILRLSVNPNDLIEEINQFLLH